jgi:hypothetical protein
MATTKRATLAIDEVVPTPATIAGTLAAGSTCSSLRRNGRRRSTAVGAVSVLAGVHVGCFERGRDHPDGRPDGQRRRQRFDLARSDAEPAAALARPRLAHEFGQTIHPWFGMIVDRFGNSQDKRAEPRYPALTAPARPRNRAREKGDNQLHRARVLEVRIHLPPAESRANLAGKC